MARRKRSKQEPAQMSIWFHLGDNQVNYIDLSQCASIVNRRFYRQGLNWAVGGFRIGYSGTHDGVNVSLRTIPTTWPVGAGWHKAFSAWKRQQDEALESSDSINAKARFNDFKVFADRFHKGAGNNLPVSPGGMLTGFVQNPQEDLVAGEWDYSQVVVPNADGVVGDTDEFSLHLMGDDIAGSKSIIKAYQLSRNFPQSPDPVGGDVATSLFSQMFNVGMDYDEVIENALDHNDDLPYDQDVYPGQISTTGGEMQVHGEVSFISTATSNYKSLPGCLVPCGLISVWSDLVEGDAEDLALQVILVPGDHRGYLAESMQEMN